MMRLPADKDVRRLIPTKKQWRPNGECGALNPLQLDCLHENANLIHEELKIVSYRRSDKKEIARQAEEKLLCGAAVQRNTGVRRNGCFTLGLPACFLREKMVS